MKLLLMLGLILGGSAFGDMHAFELPDGRTIEAEIVSSTLKRGHITLKRADGKTVSVKPEIFIEKDQEYIREWTSLNAFLSERILKIKCDDEVVKKWEEEEKEDLTYTSGTVEKDCIYNVIKYENISYNITFKNSGKVPVSGIILEYCVYYEQSAMSKDVKPKVEKHTWCGRVDVPNILAGEEIVVTTEPVRIYEDLLNLIPRLEVEHRRPGKGRIKGIRVRMHLKQNKDLIREFSAPASLSVEDYPWTTQTSPNKRKESLRW